MKQPFKFIYSGIVCLLLAAGFSAQVSAELSYLEDNRRVKLYDTTNGANYITATPSMPFSDWDTLTEDVGGYTSVNFISSMNSKGFSAAGTGAIEYWDSTVIPDYHVWPFFDVSFNASTHTLFILEGLLTGIPYDSGESGLGNASITLYSGTALVEENIIFRDFVSANSGGLEIPVLTKLNIFFYAVLAPGDYRIVAVADPQPNKAGSTFDLQASVEDCPFSNIDANNNGIDDACEPYLVDFDVDGVLDTDDNCPAVANPDQSDLDTDGAGDLCDSDIDGDSVDSPLDCNDYDASIKPFATEIKNDGIDQNCNGYDLTITINSAVYSQKRKTLNVEASSALGKDAQLVLDGYGPMSYSKRKNVWSIKIRKVTTKPSRITVSGIEGSEFSSVTAQ